MLSPLVSTSWLNENLQDPDIVVLYALLKGERSELNVPLIPGTICFDIKNDFSDTSSNFPNTIPSAAQFEQEARKLGINKNSKIVVYDHKGVYEAPRVWWLFRTMGHGHVAVLDGGLPLWKSENRPLEPYDTDSKTLGDFSSSYVSQNMRTLLDMNGALSQNDVVVLDARSNGRFCGTAPEPRAGLSSGHMPGSHNLPFTEVLDNGKFKTARELKEIFKAHNIVDQTLIFSCGSGITACIILLAAELVHSNKKAVFDGSWTEWALTEGKPIIKD